MQKDQPTPAWVFFFAFFKLEFFFNLHFLVLILLYILLAMSFYINVKGLEKLEIKR